MRQVSEVFRSCDRSDGEMLHESGKNGLEKITHRSVGGRGRGLALALFGWYEVIFGPLCLL